MKVFHPGLDALAGGQLLLQRVGLRLHLLASRALADGADRRAQPGQLFLLHSRRRALEVLPETLGAQHEFVEALDHVVDPLVHVAEAVAERPRRAVLQS